MASESSRVQQLSYGFKLCVGSILAISGISFFLKDGKVGIFKALSDEDSSSQEIWEVSGLRNLGNNCFLNVILQALASCSSFRGFLRKRLEEFEELAESMPLAVALDSLLEELCFPRGGKDVLSPRDVMIAINHYNLNFNLTDQQDAEEAFFHILSSLRGELVESYESDHGSLADATALPNCRILSLESGVAQTEHKKWQKTILGPFDGILVSALSCHSCSNQISLDFQYFQSLHISLTAGSSVESCLKHFFAAEKLEHYSCSHCWHNAAIKYLSASNEHEVDAVKLRNCSKQDTCDCKNLSSLGVLPWSKSFSQTFKQLSIARCPKVLCLHLQRASVNMFGDPIKFQGHIAFPLFLNMNLFMNTGVGIKNYEEHLPMWQSKQNCQLPFSFSNHFDTQTHSRRFNYINRQMDNNIFSEAAAQEEPSKVNYDMNIITNVQISQGQRRFSKNGGCSEINLDDSNLLEQSDDKDGLVVSDKSEQVTCDVSCNTVVKNSQAQLSVSKIGGHTSVTSYNTFLQSDDKMGGIHDLAPANLHTYRLVSVVQHYGQSGSGHYTIYRRARRILKDGDPDGRVKSTSVQWFGISDSEVYNVAEKEVLAAEASVLFYENISEC